MEKPEKSGKREVAVIVALFVAALFVWGLALERPDVVDVAKFLTPFSASGLAGAFGLHSWITQKK